MITACWIIAAILAFSISAFDFIVYRKNRLHLFPLVIGIICVDGATGHALWRFLTGGLLGA